MKREDAPQFYCCVHRRMSFVSVSSEERVPTGVLHGDCQGKLRRIKSDDVAKWATVDETQRSKPESNS